jgi:hypothetical protein
MKKGFAAIERAAKAAEIAGELKTAKILAACEDGEIYLLSDVTISRFSARRIEDRNKLVAWLLTRPPRKPR